MSLFIDGDAVFVICQVFATGTPYDFVVVDFGEQVAVDLISDFSGDGDKIRSVGWRRSTG